MEEHSPAKPSQVQAIGLGARVLLLAGAWTVAYLITMPGHGPATIIGLPWFPAGLCKVLGFEENGDGAAGVFFLGWLLLFALSIGALLARKPRTWLVVWIILLLLLIVTAAGCQKVLSEPVTATLP